MNTPSRKFLYIFLTFLLCLIIFLLRSFFYNNLVDPIARIFWLIVRSLLSIDQEVLWTILILLVFFVGLLIFPNDSQNKIRSSYINSNKIEDRVTYWKMKFQSADENAYDRDSLQQILEDLATSINDLIGTTESYEISTPRLKIKPWYLNFVNWRNLFESISSKGYKFINRELERNLNKILDSMESHMEMQNDQTSNNPKNS